MGFNVFFYVPNVIGYIRILLVLIAWILYSDPGSFVPLYKCYQLYWMFWKNSFTESPVWVQAKGFKTPLGILTIAGLHILPVWLYGYQYEVLSQTLFAPNWLQILGILVLTAGCLLGFAVEMWCIVTHLRFLLDEEDEKKN